MSITYGEALRQLRENLNEVVPSTWQDPELLRYLWNGTRRLAQRTMALRNSGNVTIVLGTQTYTLSTLPDLMLATRAVFLPTGATNSIPLELRGKNEMDEIWGTAQLQSRGDPRYAAFWGNAPSVQMILYPTPYRSGTLAVDYYAYPPMPASFTNLSLKASALVVPDGYEEVPITYAEMRARRRVGDGAWQALEQQFEQELDTINAVVSLPHHNQPGQITAEGWPLFTGVTPWWMNRPY